MRLINTASLRLERFDDDTKIPPYAILSHTWGSDEISLQQLQDAAAGDEPVRNCLKDMLGFAKIVKACERALEDQYAHIWVDTCEACSCLLSSAWCSQILIGTWQVVSTKLLLLSLVRRSTACLGGTKRLRSVMPSWKISHRELSPFARPSLKYLKRSSGLKNTWLQRVGLGAVGRKYWFTRCR
jgi:hypothetical protein